jgi:hypothetical protein
VGGQGKLGQSNGFANSVAGVNLERRASNGFGLICPAILTKQKSYVERKI